MRKYRWQKDISPSSPDLSRKYPQAMLNSLSLKKKRLLVRVYILWSWRELTLGKGRTKMPDGKEIKNLLCLEEKGSGLGLTVNGKGTDLLGSDYHLQTYGFGFHMSCGFNG